jgi:hypothetical protein
MAPVDEVNDAIVGSNTIVMHPPRGDNAVIMLPPEEASVGASTIDSTGDVIMNDR